MQEFTQKELERLRFSVYTHLSSYVGLTSHAEIAYQELYRKLCRMTGVEPSAYQRPDKP